jgi:hypothetical protein
METRRKRGFDDFSQGIDIVFRDPAIEEEHRRIDQRHLIEQVLDLPEFALNPCRRGVRAIANP